MKNVIFAFFAALLVFSSASYAAEQSTIEKSTIEKAVAEKPASISAKAAVQQDVININTADAQTLAKLKGVGPKKAEAIIAWRKTNGNFKTVEQFADVKGIGSSTLEANRKNIRL